MNIMDILKVRYIQWICGVLETTSYFAFPVYYFFITEAKEFCEYCRQVARLGDTCIKSGTLIYFGCVRKIIKCCRINLNVPDEVFHQDNEITKEYFGLLKSLVMEWRTSNKFFFKKVA